MEVGSQESMQCLDLVFFCGLCLTFDIMLPVLQPPHLTGNHYDGETL